MVDAENAIRQKAAPEDVDRCVLNKTFFSKNNNIDNILLLFSLVAERRAQLEQTKRLVCVVVITTFNIIFSFLICYFFKKIYIYL